MIQDKEIIKNKMKILQEKIVNVVNESDYDKPIEINDIECNFECNCWTDKSNFLSGINFFYDLLKQEIEDENK